MSEKNTKKRKLDPGLILDSVGLKRISEPKFSDRFWRENLNLLQNPRSANNFLQTIENNTKATSYGLQHQMLEVCYRSPDIADCR